MGADPVGCPCGCGAGFPAVVAEREEGLREDTLGAAPGQLAGLGLWIDNSSQSPLGTAQMILAHRVQALLP